MSLHSSGLRQPLSSTVNPGNIGGEEIAVIGCLSDPLPNLIERIDCLRQKEGGQQHQAASATLIPAPGPIIVVTEPLTCIPKTGGPSDPQKYTLEDIRHHVLATYGPTAAIIVATAFDSKHLREDTLSGVIPVLEIKDVDAELPRILKRILELRSAFAARLFHDIQGEILIVQLSQFLIDRTERTSDPAQILNVAEKSLTVAREAATRIFEVLRNFDPSREGAVFCEVFHLKRTYYLLSGIGYTLGFKK